MECDYGYEFQTPLSTWKCMQGGQRQFKIVAGPRGRPLIRPEMGRNMHFQFKIVAGPRGRPLIRPEIS